MIKIENLVKIYGENETALKALNDVSVEIPDGKFVAIVGKSGSGKSTLLNLIGGLDKCTLGSICVNEHKLDTYDKNQLADYRNKTVGFIFQSFYLEPNFTVLENVVMPLLIAGENKAEREIKAKDVIEKLNITDKLSTKVAKLSGGQRQRVSIARALVSNPQIILADEPTGNLDSQNGEEVIKILRDIVKEGKTVLLVTHNMDDANKADYIIKIKDGKIEEITNEAIW